MIRIVICTNSMHYNMKQFYLVLFFIINWGTSFTQYNKKKLFIDENLNTIKTAIYIAFQKPDTTINATVFNAINVTDSAQIIKIISVGYEETLMYYHSFLTTDTIQLYRQANQIDEIIISSNPIRKESEDSMHVVDFHFINGKSVVLQKSIYHHKEKFICYENNCFHTNEKSKLYYHHINGQQVVEIKDSIFLFDGVILYPVESKLLYDLKLKSIIDSNDSLYYFKNNFFYELIDEYSCLDLENNKEKSLHLTYDSLSFIFIANFYKQFARTPPIFLYYKYPHRNANKKFTNQEKISIKNLNVETGQLFKYLAGNPGFVDQAAILEKSRSEACLLDSTFYIFDFNTKKVYAYHRDQLIQTISLNLKNEWYKNEYKLDETLKKAYFLFKTEEGLKLFEIDLNSGKSSFIEAPDALNSYHHWEISGGRLYFLKTNPDLDWQRKLFSISMDEFRTK